MNKANHWTEDGVRGSFKGRLQRLACSLPPVSLHLLLLSTYDQQWDRPTRLIQLVRRMRHHSKVTRCSPVARHRPRPTLASARARSRLRFIDISTFNNLQANQRANQDPTTSHQSSRSARVVLLASDQTVRCSSAVHQSSNTPQCHLIHHPLVVAVAQPAKA